MCMKLLLDNMKCKNENNDVKLLKEFIESLSEDQIEKLRNIIDMHTRN